VLLEDEGTVLHEDEGRLYEVLHEDAGTVCPEEEGANQHRCPEDSDNLNTEQGNNDAGARGLAAG
jgi:hypothetical protein